MEQAMIEIVLTVCAIANPANCEEKSLQFACKHPAWTTKKWSCDYPGSRKRDI
jgi:hypothetical protein